MQYDARNRVIKLALYDLRRFSIFWEINLPHCSFYISQCFLHIRAKDKFDLCLRHPFKRAGKDFFHIRNRAQFWLKWLDNVAVNIFCCGA